MDNQDLFSIPYLISNVGTPFLLGIAVGYFSRKMLHAVLFLSGGIVVLLFIAEYCGIVQINNAQLLQSADVAVEAVKTSSNFLLMRLSAFSTKGISATGGFILGFRLR